MLQTLLVPYWFNFFKVWHVAASFTWHWPGSAPASLHLTSVPSLCASWASRRDEDRLMVASSTNLNLEICCLNILFARIPVRDGVFQPIRDDVFQPVRDVCSRQSEIMCSNQSEMMCSRMISLMRTCKLMHQHQEFCELHTLFPHQSLSPPIFWTWLGVWSKQWQTKN